MENAILLPDQLCEFNKNWFIRDKFQGLISVRLSCKIIHSLFIRSARIHDVAHMLVAWCYTRKVNDDLWVWSCQKSQFSSNGFNLLSWMKSNFYMCIQFIFSRAYKPLVSASEESVSWNQLGTTGRLGCFKFRSSQFAMNVIWNRQRQMPLLSHPIHCG